MLLIFLKVYCYTFSQTDERFQYFVELVVGSNRAISIKFLRFLTLNIVFFEKFGKNENNIICAKPEKVLLFTL